VSPPFTFPSWVYFTPVIAEDQKFPTIERLLRATSDNILPLTFVGFCQVYLVLKDRIPGGIGVGIQIEYKSVYNYYVHSYVPAKACLHLYGNHLGSAIAESTT